MDQYEFFIDDDRYVVVPCMTEQAESVEAARKRAGEILARSFHMRKVMVYLNGDYLFAVTRQAA